MEMCPHGIGSTNSIVTSMCIGSQRMFARKASHAGCPEVGHLFSLDFTHSSRVYSFQTWFRGIFLYCRYLREKSSNYSGELDQGILSLYFKFWQGGWWQTSDNYRQKYGFVGRAFDQYWKDLCACSGSVIIKWETWDRWLSLRPQSLHKKLGGGGEGIQSFKSLLYLLI